MEQLERGDDFLDVADRDEARVSCDPVAFTPKGEPGAGEAEGLLHDAAAHDGARDMWCTMGGWGG